MQVISLNVLCMAPKTSLNGRLRLGVEKISKHLAVYNCIDTAKAALLSLLESVLETYPNRIFIFTQA